MSNEHALGCQGPGCNNNNYRDGKGGSQDSCYYGLNCKCWCHTPLGKCRIFVKAAKNFGKTMTGESQEPRPAMAKAA